jgi:uncharacterized protein (DUF2147 family)
MTMTSTLRAAGLLAAALTTGAPAFGQGIPAIIEGTWKTQLESEITIEACDQGYCGRISKIVVPEAYKQQYGQQLEEIAVEDYFDYYNKDPALRSRPILNLQILTLRPSANPFRYDGEIYNPEDGNIYGGYVEVVGADVIKLNGCVLYGLICRGEEWSRVLTPPEETGEAAAPAQ